LWAALLNFPEVLPKGIPRVNTFFHLFLLFFKKGYVWGMRRKTTHLIFRATPELKRAVERAAEAQGLKSGEWMHAVIEKAVTGGVMVRQHVTYEVIEPNPTLKAAESGK
jgi:hypothetical protein